MLGITYYAYLIIINTYRNYIANVNDLRSREFDTHLYHLMFFPQNKDIITDGYGILLYF